MPTWFERGDCQIFFVFYIGGGVKNATNIVYTWVIPRPFCIFLYLDKYSPKVCVCAFFAHQHLSGNVSSPRHYCFSALTLGGLIAKIHILFVCNACYVNSRVVVTMKDAFLKELSH